MRWFWLSLLIVVVAFIFFLPNILSTRWGNERVVAFVNQSIQGTLKVQKIELKWLGPQKASHLELLDPSGKKIAKLDTLETHTSLFTLIFKRNTYGATTLMHPNIALERDLEGISDLEKSLSKKKSKQAWPTLTGKFTVVDGIISIKAPKIEDIEITSLNLDYFPDKKLFHVRALTEEGGIKGEIVASGSLGEKRHILAQIENFPVAILDQLQNTEVYTQAIGDKINIKIESVKTGDVATVSADVQSRLLNGKIEGEVKEGFIVFSPKSYLNFEITPALFQEVISPNLQKEWSLADKTTLNFDIQEGEVPLSLDWSKSRVEARARLGRVELHHTKNENFSLNDVEGTFVSNGVTSLKMAGEIVGKERSKFQAELEMNSVLKFNVSSEGFPFSLLELVFEETEALDRFFGDTVAIKVQGEYGAKKGLFSTFDLNSFSTGVRGEVKGEKLDALTFQINGTKRFSGSWKEVLGESTHFSFSGDAALVKRILTVSQFEGMIENDIAKTAIKGQLGKKGAPFAYDRIKVSGTGTLLKLPPNPALKEAKLNKGEFAFLLDGHKNLITATTETSFTLGDGSSVKEAKGELKVKNFIQEGRLEYKKSEVTFEGDLDHFPTAFFASWLPELPDLIGPAVNLVTKGHYTPQKITLDLNATSPGFSTEVALEIGPNFHITQNKPGHLMWKLSPTRYKALVSLLSKEEVPYELSSSPTLNIEIEKISCPEEYPNSVKKFLCRSGIKGKIEVGPMLFVNPETREKFTLQNISGGILGENFSRKMHIDLTGAVSAPKLSQKEQPHFTVDIDLLNAWNEEAKFATSGEIDLHHLPASQLLGIIPLDPIFRAKIEAMLGEIINARIRAQIAEMKGPITLDLASSNLKGIFPFQLDGNQILLRDVLQAEMTLTDEISDTFLRDINPMLIKGARSDHPLKLYVAPEGFSIPIPWSFKELTIENAVVDIGKIYVHNGGAINELMKFLKSNPPKDKMMRAWFTPVFLSLKEGVLQHERFDMLLHKKVHIALWGRVDLIKSKVWMTLGIAPSTLKQRFNVLGLTKKDMFQVKMRGQLNNVELDWSSAYTRIGILIARLAGGPPGYLVGGLLEQVISALGEEPTPPPTTYPFPWDDKKWLPSATMPQKTAPSTTSAEKGRKKLLEFLIP